MAMGESRRKKLEWLLRRRAGGQAPSGREYLRAHGHSAVNRSGKDAGEPVTPSEPVPLADACGGCEVSAEDGGCYWLIRKPLREVEGESRAIATQYATVLRGARQSFDELSASPALCHAANAAPGDLLFMDTETCGLAGTMIFLVGLMTYEADDLVFDQFLARDYSEEAAILRQFVRRQEQCGILVSFNGKSFDMTQIRDRSAFHGIEAPWSVPPHLDLLHECRRRWKGRLKRFTLQNLERHFLGRHRAGDIPGEAIPEAYHSFVRTGDARRMRDILHHNLLDLLTMAQLVTILLTSCDPVDQ